MRTGVPWRDLPEMYSSSSLGSSADLGGAPKSSAIRGAADVSGERPAQHLLTQSRHLSFGYAALISERFEMNMPGPFSHHACCLIDSTEHAKAGNEQPSAHVSRLQHSHRFVSPAIFPPRNADLACIGLFHALL